RRRARVGGAHVPARGRARPARGRTRREPRGALPDRRAAAPRSGRRGRSARARVRRRHREREDRGLRPHPRARALTRFGDAVLRGRPRTRAPTISFLRSASRAKVSPATRLRVRARRSARRRSSGRRKQIRRSRECAVSRRGKDLFYLVEQRERGGRGQPEAAARRRAPSGTMTAKVRQWLGQPGGSRRAHESGAPVGFLVAAVGLAALGVGFALGRFLPRAEAPVDLTVRSETSGPRRPGPVEAKTSPGAGPAASPTASAADDLPKEKWEEVVSKRWFEVLRFPASQ